MVLQTLLEAITLCQPQPKLPSELIKYLGKTFCAWHTAIPLLESHVMIFTMVRLPPRLVPPSTRRLSSHPPALLTLQCGDPHSA